MGLEANIFRQPSPTGNPPPDPVVGKDPFLGASVTKSGKSLDARGKQTTAVITPRDIGHAANVAGYGIVGEPFSETQLGKLVQGRKSVTDLVTDPFKQMPAGQVNAMMPPLGPFKAGGLVESAASRAAAPVKAAAKAYQPRTITANDLVQQLPKARSRITQTVIEKPADKISTKLGQNETATNTPVVRLATAPERAVKAAGRSQRLERGRAAAAVSEHLNAIKAVKAGSPEDTANFWYAQLPATHRNAEGLTAVQGMQKQHLDYLTSGKALEDATAREKAVNAAIQTATDAKTRMPLLTEREQIGIYKSDIPNQINDTSASIAHLGDLIAKPPKANDAAIAAAHALGNDSAQVLVDAGRLNPDRVEPRRTLLARTLGLTPDGTEAYIGHRQPVPGNRFPFTPKGGTGRVATPAGMTSQNKLVLATNGRLRPSLRVAAEDWGSTQVFRQANVSRDTLAKVGTPFTGHVPEDAVLINPKGRTVPANWKTDDLAQFSDSYNDTGALRNKAQQIVDEFSADGSDPAAIERIKQQALKQGVKWNELRVVPRRLVDRYYDQFRASTSRGKGGKAYDTVVDAVATSIIFARLGYVPKNFVQNVVMALPHQGPFLLVNAVRAGQVMADPKLRAFFEAEVGQTGATGALGREALHKKIVGAPVNLVSKLADDPARITSFLHEAAAEGVISKVRPLLGDKDRRALVRLFRDPTQRPLLNDIRSRTVEAMADFSRLTPDQSRVARRLLIIPGWLMAGSRYPFHFAATHPIRSALLAYIALGEPGAPDHFNKSIDQYFTGSSYRRGIQTPAGRIRTSSLNPVSTPWDLANSAVDTVRGKGSAYDFTKNTAFDYVQPFARAATQYAQGGGFKKSFEPLVPNVKLGLDLLHPKASPTYPEDATRLGRLKREVGVLPVKVNDNGSGKSSRKRGSHNIFAGGSKSGGNIYAPPSGGGSGNIFR